MSDIRTILDERGKRYGRFAEHAFIAQIIKGAMADSPGWERLSLAQREALDMIGHKIARILNGDPSYVDSWADIAGYAQLVVDILEMADNTTSSV